MYSHSETLFFSSRDEKGIMRKIAALLITVSSLMFLFSFVVAAAESQAKNGGDATISERMQFLDKNSNYVVKIFSIGENSDSPFGGVISGTGFAYKDEEERWAILTNSHVLGPLSNQTVWVVFEKEYAAHKTRIIGRDHVLDVALLEMPSSRPRHVVSAPVNFSVLLKVGDEVYALGHPLGNREITAGWVNALSNARKYWFISSQTPLHPGNSGGPLIRFSREGKPEVVGINTMISGIGLKSMSINIRYVERVLPRLLRERIVAHASAGFIIEDSFKIPPQVFELQGMRYPPETHGIMVVKTEKMSPAEKAGFNNGDIITKVVFKGRELTFKNTRALHEFIFFDLRPGDALTFFVKRGTQTIEKNLVLGEYKVSNE